MKPLVLLAWLGTAAGLRSLDLGFGLAEKTSQRMKRQAGTSSAFDMSMVDSILCSVRCWTLAGPEISRQIQRALSGRTGFSNQDEQMSFKRSCQAYADIKDCEQRGKSIHVSFTKTMISRLAACTCSVTYVRVI